MASATNGPGNNVDQIRYQSYIGQMERDQDAKIKETEDSHRERLSNLLVNHDDQTQHLRKDYEVKISEEAENLERKLALIRERNEGLTTQEKEAGEKESEKIHLQYTQKIDQQKAVGDEQIAKLQNYYKKASEELHHNFEKERMRVASQKGKT